MKTYTEQGLVFTLKRTTPRNRDIVQEYFAKYGDNMVKAISELEMVAKGGQIDVDGIEEIPDEYQMYFDLFGLITEGPHEKLDFQDFDVKVAEQALADFLPSAKRTVLERTGSLPSRNQTIPAMNPMQT